ncbi:MAG: aminopeptidase [Lachnospiraceae bacterium]|nr:aminopeptidase [Lachnospiraceae bacterium]
MEDYTEVWKDTEDTKERMELCAERLSSMGTEETVGTEYRDFFRVQAKKMLLLFEYAKEVKEGTVLKRSEAECRAYYDELYKEILPQNYGESYANPKYAVKRFGKRYGRLLTYLAAKLNAQIFYAAEGNCLFPVMAAELLIELYNYFEEFHEYTFKECREALYSFETDNAELFLAWRAREQFDPAYTFAKDIIMEADGTDLRYLYRYGEYITENEFGIARFLQGLSEEKIKAAAENVVGGYLRGFKVMQVPLVKGQTVGLRYAIGFERIMKEVIRLLEAEGLNVASVRTAVAGRHARKAGYTVTNVNIQYDYDHRNDEGLLADKQWYVRKETALRRVYETEKEVLSLYAGPLVLETFGERLPLPKNAEEAIQLDKRQQRLKVESTGRLGAMVEQYIPSEQTSFTIVAYPLPSIGEKFEEIFEETMRLNQLDNEVYRKVQQCIIDALDKAQAVRVTGRGKNRTDITVQLWKLNDPEKETIFENCTADVNIPAGEVFTSPVLKGTDGTLHVTSVFLGSTEYKNLEIAFKDGMTTDYSCENYASEEENKKFIKENLLKNHERLPLGEFAIGTNTIAYTMGRKFGIAEVLPILIAEKTGPHFAIGDTCYSHSEDHKVYNPDGKEIVARTNECAELRHTEPEKAYFHCHTDITIPYDELGEIIALCEDGTKITIIKNGRFVLPGTELLNEALEEN